MWKTTIWNQFGAAIDMLENAMVACPDSLWGDRTRRPEFWYVAYHTLFFLDLYLSESPEGFAPPAPFTLSELDPSGILPERVYSKSELQTYLAHCRRKFESVVGGLTEKSARAHREFRSVKGTLAEVLIYATRHVQHHAAQLNLILRQVTDASPRWVSQAKTKPTS